MITPWESPGSPSERSWAPWPCATRPGRHFSAPSRYNSPRDVPNKVPTDKLQTELASHNPTHDPADELLADDFNSTLPQ